MTNHLHYNNYIWALLQQFFSFPSPKQTSGHTPHIPQMALSGFLSTMASNPKKPL